MRRHYGSEGAHSIQCCFQHAHHRHEGHDDGKAECWHQQLARAPAAAVQADCVVCRPHARGLRPPAGEYRGVVLQHVLRVRLHAVMPARVQIVVPVRAWPTSLHSALARIVVSGLRRKHRDEHVLLVERVDFLTAGW